MQTLNRRLPSVYGWLWVQVAMTDAVRVCMASYEISLLIDKELGWNSAVWWLHYNVSMGFSEAQRMHH